MTESKSLPRRICQIIRSTFFVSPTLFVLLLSTQVDPRAASQDLTRLELGQKVKRDMKSGERHIYHIELATGQFLHAIVEQYGIDVEAGLFGPDGKKVFNVDSPTATLGAEHVLVIAAQTGVHRLEIIGLGEQISGRYEAWIDAMRFPAEIDQQHVAAEQTWQEANYLRLKRDRQSVQQAISKCETARVGFQRAGNATREILILNTVGLMHWSLSEYPKALECFFQSLPIARTAGDRRGEADALHDLGLVYGTIGDQRRAVDYYEQALLIRREIGDQVGQGMTISSLGVAYNSLGDKQKALDYHQQALPLRKRSGDREGEAATLNSIGRVYQDWGEQQKAYDYFSQALAIVRTTTGHRIESLVLHNLGVLHYELGKTRRAIEFYSQAIPIWQKVGNSRGEAYTRAAMGKAYGSLGDWQQASESSAEALKLMRAIGDKFGEARQLSNVAQVQTALGQETMAFENYRQAIQQAHAVGDRVGEAAALFGMAAFERNRNRFDRAHEHIEKAIQYIEGMRADVVSRELRMSYFASVQSYYEFYIDLLMQVHEQAQDKGSAALALQISERARARNLLEILYDAKIDLRNGIDSSLLERERQAQEKLNLADLRRRQLLVTKQAGQMAEMEKEIETLKTELQNVQSQILKASPRYNEISNPEFPSLSDIQQRLLDDNTLLLEYALGESRSFLWVISKTELKSFALPSRAKIEAQSIRVYELLTARNQGVPGETPRQEQVRVAPADADFPKQAAELSRMILSPAAKLLGKNRLLIVTPGALQLIPFAALPIPEAGRIESGHQAKASQTSPFSINGQPFIPLVSNHEIIALPSASTLIALRRQVEKRQPALKTVALLADPVYEADDERFRLVSAQTTNLASTRRRSGYQSRGIGNLGETGERVRFSRLYYSGWEADEIARLFPQSKVLKASAFQAKRETVVGGALSDYRVIHFATHSRVNDQHPELSGIVLSLLDEQGREIDGFLRLHEIYGLRLQADLAVLSGCSTGLGKEIKGEGLISLTRGFMYAQVPRVIVSVWAVKDQPSAELMVRFYTHMFGKQRLSAAAALRAAQLEMLKSKQWSHPYFWAGFALQGEWR